VIFYLITREQIKMERKKNHTNFTDEQLKVLAKRFKILSEVSRLKILRTLFHGEKCVTDIINATGLLQANVSKQLKILESDGVVNCRPQGLQRFYSVNDPVVQIICNEMCEVKK
jgi:DNA-binding transcriptional ArsR family regulator